MYLFFLFPLFCYIIQGFIRIHTIHTAIVNFAPMLKLHHLVIVKHNDPLDNTNKIYTIDFTPIDQSNITTICKLLMGQNVPGEIRIRKLSNMDLTNEDKIIEEWIDQNNNTMNSNQICNITDPKLCHFVSKIKIWDNKMNLYTHNCQHFSKYVYKIYDEFMPMNNSGCIHNLQSIFE